MMPHQIDIAIPTQHALLVERILAKADRHNVSVFLSKEPLVKYMEDSFANGYFEDFPRPRLQVGCGQVTEKWLQVLLHESSHMDQWIEQSPYWTKAKILGVDAIAILELWLHERVELNTYQKWQVVEACRNLELDCERRTLRKIETTNIGVSPAEYIQRANAYVLFYNMIGYYRRWYASGMEPYNNPDIIAAMPHVLHPDAWYHPENVPEHYYDALKRCV